MITLRKSSKGTTAGAGTTSFAYCSPLDQPGHAVRIVAVENGAVTVSKVNPAYADQMPAYAVIVSKYSETQCVVQTGGDMTVNKVLEVDMGKKCYVGMDGYLTTDVPTADLSPSGVVILQYMGTGLGPTGVSLNPSQTTLEVGV